MSPRSCTAILALVLLAACAAPDGGATVSSGAATVRASVSSGPARTDAASASPAAHMPEVPAGFPMMDGMAGADPAGEAGVIAEWRTAATGAEVYAFYEAELPAAGYTVDLAGPGGAAAVFRFTPPGQEQLQLDLYADGSGTTVQLVVPHP